MSARLAPLVLVTAVALHAAEYSEKDRTALLEQLEQGPRLLAVVLESVSAEQARFQPDSSRWSILQVVEHLVLAEKFLFDILKETLDKSKPLPDEQPLPDPEPMDRMILRQVADRSQKAKAPEQLIPKDRFSNRDEAQLEFAKRRENTMEFVRNTKLDLRRYRLQGPAGPIDAHQWLLMMAAHTERHAKQIEEIKSHELYPKN